MRGEGIVAIALLIAALFALLIYEAKFGGKLGGLFAGENADSVTPQELDQAGVAYWISKANSQGDFKGDAGEQYNARPWMPPQFVTVH